MRPFSYFSSESKCPLVCSTLGGAMSEVNTAQITINAKQLEVGYHNTSALSISDLNISGNIIALAGHNGAGKSTLLKAILGLLKPISGSINILDHYSGKQLTPEKDMAFCPENGSVFLDISVKEYLKLWCRLKAGDVKLLDKQIGRDLIELLELKPLLKRKGRELSKGQKQRVQIAAGFFASPRLFLFDEPFDGLDVQRTQELMQLIRSKTDNISFIISSHRMDVIERLADQIIVLENSKVKDYGIVTDVTRRLCGSIFQITNLEDAKGVSEQLENLFPKAYIYHTGDSLKFISPEMNIEQLKSAVLKIEQNGAVFGELHPLLTDAMGFHLKSVRGDRNI
jgi:ABC-2 type transport system ATP-binding protein